MKNRRNTYRKQLSSRILAFLLFGLFVNAMVIESLHHHQDHHITNPVKVDKNHHQAEVQSGKLNCKLCEVIKQHAHFYDLPAPVQPVLILEESHQTFFTTILKHPAAYILAAANKGPPVCFI